MENFAPHVIEINADSIINRCLVSQKKNNTGSNILYIYVKDKVLIDTI